MSIYDSPLLNLPVPELIGDTGLLNTGGINLADFIGKVVLIEFWTFGCNNCVNVIPFMKKIYFEFKDKDVEFVTIHTPEFSFEKLIENVKNALNKHGIEYPVILDNDFNIWKSFRNRWWPHFFLIDKMGIIRYNFVGEGHDKEIKISLKNLIGE